MTTHTENGITRTAHVANCPHCAQPHHYVEMRFPVENDQGYWTVECSKCKGEFVVELLNPMESGGAASKHALDKHDGAFTGNRNIVASDVLRHDIDLNRNAWSFNYDAVPLYRCAKNANNLEELADSALRKEISAVLSAYNAAVNYLLKGGADHDVAVVRLPLSCACGGKHTATYYARLAMGTDDGPTSEDQFLLADVSNSALEENLDGIVSKSDAMDLLEKLIIRWNLLAEQILIVSPFVGTTYTSHEKQLEIWSWLLGILSPNKGLFLTRGATYTSYKKAMEADGIPVDLLEKFGLENKIVAMDVRKQDFHAKFFAAISETGCEVMSGSANLVRGPSVENISFRRMAKPQFDARYLYGLNLKKALPAPKAPSRHWVLIDQGPKGWRAQPKVDAPYVEGEKQKRQQDKPPDVGRDHQVSIDAAHRILRNANDFLNGGLELLFSSDLSSRTAKVAVVSIQTSIELLAKYRMVRASGLQAIVQGTLPARNLEQAVTEGNFSTLGFGAVLDLVDSVEGLREDERSLIQELVNLRNDLVHFASEIDEYEVKLQCAHILAHVLPIFALGDDRDDGGIQDYRRFMTEENFQELTSFEPYRNEAVDAAHDSLDTEKVLKCYLCGNESFSRRASDVYLCYCCGTGLVDQAIAFATCSVCGLPESVVFDPLNETNSMHYGKCMSCDVKQWVWECIECGTITAQVDKSARQACSSC